MLTKHTMKFETMYLYKILTVLFHVLIIKISSDKYNIIMLLSLSQLPKQIRLKPSIYKGLSRFVCIAFWGLF